MVKFIFFLRDLLKDLPGYLEKRTQNILFTVPFSKDPLRGRNFKMKIHFHTIFQNCCNWQLLMPEEGPIKCYVMMKCTLFFIMVCMKLNPGTSELQKPVYEFKFSFFTLKIQI